MSKPFDASLKDLLEGYAADWLAFLGLSPAAPVEVIDADVSTVSAAADKVMRVAGDQPWLMHLELQTSPKMDLAEWLHWYNALVGHRHRLLVRSVLVLLRPAADSPLLDGIYREQFPGEPAYLEFRYRGVRVWQVPVELLLEGGLGLLPLAPLANVGQQELPGVVRRMHERFSKETPERADVLWTTTYILMGLRYQEEFAAQLLRGVSAMKESVTYQAILAEGEAKGQAEGRVQGAIQELKKALLRLGHKRFGAPDPKALAGLEAITDLARLERMRERLLEVSSWPELLATP